MKLFMKIFLFIFSVSFIACSKEQFMLDDYAKYPVKFAKQEVVYPNNDFKIYIPKSWEWKVEDYNSPEVILVINAGSPPQEKYFVDVISVIKMKGISAAKNLESETQELIKLSEKSPAKLKILGSGKTNLLNRDAYYIHTRSNTGKYGESEMIEFIVKSNNDENFYHLTASASRTKELKKNMAIMIQCLKTFEQNPKN